MMLSRNRGLGQFLLVGCAVLALMMVLGTSVFAQQAAKGNAPGQDETSANASGQQVAIDAKSGKLRKPTQEEIDTLVSGMKLNDSAVGLKATRVGNGSVVMDLEGRFENATIAKINPDGTLSMSCVNNAKDAEAFLKADTTKAKQPKAGTTGQKLEEK